MLNSLQCLVLQDAEPIVTNTVTVDLQPLKLDIEHLLFRLLDPLVFLDVGIIAIRVDVRQLPTRHRLDYLFAGENIF
ncbi:hypothetical protein [Halosolutus halophilus]|uniref:hypothetical protein n=1 Tax=Halosolutus halophilus TaxID=1552990 RepID=UPI002234F334|nr:hypothetical protein [Halosolutus halophilus]